MSVFDGMSKEQIEAAFAKNPEAKAKFAAAMAKAQPELVTGLGGGKNNPAPDYSIGAGLKAKQHLDVATGISTWTDPRTGEVIEGYKPGSTLEGTGGIVYVGNDPNGDTPEARAQMVEWLRGQNPAYADNNFSFADQYYGDANQRWQWSDPKIQGTGMLTGEANTAQEAATVPGKPRVTGPLTPEQAARMTPEQLQHALDTNPEARGMFFNGVLGQAYDGTLGLDQLRAVDRSTLTQTERAAYDASLRALTGYEAVTSGTGKLTDQDIGEFVRGMYNLETRSPEQFKTLMESNPELAVKYLASMGTGRYMTGQDIDPKQYRQQAEGLAYQMGVDAGYGEDGKQDGKSFVGGYNTMWNDVNSEDGRADFQKLGRPGAMKGGFKDFVEDNPVQVVATIASVFIPMAAPAIAATLGVSNAVASGIISAGLSAAGGGDLKEVLLAGLTTYGMGEMVNQLPAIMNSISPEAAQSFAEITKAAETGKDVVEGGAGLLSPGGLLKGAGEIADGARDYNDNIDVPQGIEWQQHDTSDVLGDVQVQVPDYSIEKTDEAGGGASSSAADSSPSDSTADGGEIGGELEPFPDYWDKLPDDPKHDWPDAGYDFEGDSKYSIEETGSGALVITHKPTGAVRTVSGGVDLDGAPSAGSDVPETTVDDVEDPNDWEGGLVLGPSWDDIFGDSTQSGSNGNGTNNTGGTDGTNTTGGSTDGTGGEGTGGNGEGSGDGDGNGDGEGDGEGTGSDGILAATGLLAGATGENDFEKFMYRVETNFPMLERLSPSQLLQALEESV